MSTKYKDLPGYKLAKHKHDILPWLKHVLLLSVILSSCVNWYLDLPRAFYPYYVVAGYVLYYLAASPSTQLGSHKFYVDGIQRTCARGWLHTLTLAFVFPVVAWHLLFRPEYEEQFVAPRWVRQTFLFGLGCSLLGTSLIHLMLFHNYMASLLVRFFDCLAINMQLGTGLLPYGQSWRNKQICAFNIALTSISGLLLTYETYHRWKHPPSNAGIKVGGRILLEWYRLYITAFQGGCVCLFAVIIENLSIESIISSICLVVGLMIFGFGNQYKVEMPWNNINVWHFHDDFHILVTGTQICGFLITMRTKN